MAESKPVSPCIDGKASIPSPVLCSEGLQLDNKSSTSKPEKNSLFQTSPSPSTDDDGIALPASSQTRSSRNGITLPNIEETSGLPLASNDEGNLGNDVTVQKQHFPIDTSPLQCTSCDVVDHSSTTAKSRGFVTRRSPMQCTSLTSKSSIKNENSAKTIVDGNVPAQCTSLNDVNLLKEEGSGVSGAAIKGDTNVPCQLTARVASSKKVESSAKNFISAAENLPKQCESLEIVPQPKDDLVSKNAIGTVSGKVPQQCESVGYRPQTKDFCENNTIDSVKREKTGTQCSSLKSSTLSTASIIPTQCSSLNVTKPSKTPVKGEAVVKTIGGWHNNFPEDNCWAEGNKESFGAPVACTDLEESKVNDELGIAFEEQVKTQDIENNMLSSAQDEETDEEDVFCSGNVHSDKGLYSYNFILRISLTYESSMYVLVKSFTSQVAHRASASASADLRFL